ncbi:recombination protein O N-terminal domain-containing protein [Faucicola atlantae]|uniref:recombination protein O N-terminal domain-containing protein n=1 Tax=Faucicola atlantae TaxID=34059 RepID=UPI00338F05CE
MRQQPLTGYVLHQKPYQENRGLLTLFSAEFGIVHGIGKKICRYSCRYKYLPTVKVI